MAEFLGGVYKPCETNPPGSTFTFLCRQSLRRNLFLGSSWLRYTGRNSAVTSGTAMFIGAETTSSPRRGSIPRVVTPMRAPTASPHKQAHYSSGTRAPPSKPEALFSQRENLATSLAPQLPQHQIITHLALPMSLGAFLIITVYKVFVYIVGLFSGIAFAIWLRSRL